MFVRAGLLLLLHALPNHPVYVAAGVEQLEPSRRLDVSSDVDEITTAADWGFRLAVDRMKIQESTILPSWLKLDKDLGVLLGHPRENDIGVYTIPLEMNGAYGKQVIFIRVVPEDSAMSPVHNVACPVGEPVTSLTVIVDVDLDNMSGEQRIQLLQHVMPFAGVELRNIKLSAVQNNRLFDTSAFLAGPGNARRMEYVGALLSWQLGCALDIVSLPSLAVQQPAKEGKMATALEYPVLGWHVANHKPYRPKKIKRQVFVTPTPIIAAIPPTKTGQVEEPMARVIPSQISPSFLATTSVVLYSAADALSESQQLLPTTTLPTTTWPSSLHAGPDTPSKPFAGFDVISPVPKLPTKTVVTEELEKKHESSSSADKTPAPEFGETMVTPYDSVEWPVLGENRPPQLHIPIGFLNVDVGTYFEHRIPLNTFIDSEDGLLDRLHLKLASKDGIDGSGPWMGLDSSKIMLYGLPPNDKTLVGKHKFVLTATDKAGASSESTFKVMVHRPPHGSQPSVLFETKLNNNFENFAHDLDLKVGFVKKLTAALGGKNASVLTIEDIERGSVVVTWSNNTLPLEPCPLVEVHRLCDQMISETGAPRESFHASMKPEFDVLKVKAYGTEKCADSDFMAVGHRKILPSTVSVPTPVATVARPEAMPAQDRNILYTIIPLILVALLILLLLLIGVCLCYRHKRKGKMILEEQHSFVRKGVPVIFSDEMDDSKPSLSSNKPLILHEEKAPLSASHFPSYALQECLPPPPFDGQAESRKRHQKGTSMKLVTTTYVPP